MPGLLQHRIALVAAAAVISGAAATAVAVAFPGRVTHAPVAADQGIVATPTPYVPPPPPPPPTPTPTPTPAPVRSTYSASESGGTPVYSQPTAASGGAPAQAPGDCSGLPGPSCSAVNDQPSQPQP